MVSDQSVPGATRKPDKIPADYDPMATGATSEVNMAHNNGARSPSQASPNDGRIFPAKAKGSRPIYFDDDGPGIPESEYVNVLKPFYRIDKSRGQNKSGVGLGLSIANDVVRSHGGNISFEKSSLDGLRVKITLPF